MQTSGKRVGNEPHESATRWHPRPLRGAGPADTGCLSVCPSVCRAQLSPEPGLARADSWGSCPPDACWTENSRSVSSLSRSPKATVKQSSSGMGREGFGVMADPISAQRSPRRWVRCSKVGTSGCTQHGSGAWWGPAHLCARSP